MVSFVVAASVCAQERVGPPYQLEDVEYINSFVGSKEAKELLAKQGFVVTRQQFTQIFVAYLRLDQSKPWLPNYVTVDSAWHAYHVLMEEGVRQLEEQQAAVLQEFSARLLVATRTRSRKSGDLYWDLAAFAAVGLALQDSAAVSSLDSDLRKVVSGITSALETGSAPGRVLFFGLPIAPEHFRAASFYTEDARLRGYFVARQWHAKCAFRLKSAAETERALHLALLINGDNELKTLYDQLCGPYDQMLGPEDDASVKQYVELAKQTLGLEYRTDQISASLQAFRKKASGLPDPKVNDQLLGPKQYARFVEETRGFRLLPARRCPSAVLLQRTSHPMIKGRMLPSGVDFFSVGPLACEPARRALRASVADQRVFDAITGAEAEPLPDSLHGKALGLLKLLQRPLPEDAPTPLRTSAWQDKQLWTALGAWAEQRHTWAAHLKLAVTVLDGDEQPPGYVSPYPEFFRALGELARRTAPVLTKFRQDLDPTVAGREVLEGLDVEARGLSGTVVSDREAMKFSTTRHRLWKLYCAYRRQTETPDPSAQVRRPPQAETLDRLARRWIKGENLDAGDWELIQQWATPEGRDPVKLLPRFADTCDRLAEIANRELDGESLDDEDAQFIRNYGERLAAFHFYDSYAWMYPVDDFPLVAPVLLNPLTGQILYAGLGRPEALYVILHVDGKLVLHRGAVLSYREFPRPTGESVDDDSWAAEVKTGDIPPPPKFTSSFRKVTLEEQTAESKRLRRWSSEQDASAPDIGAVLASRPSVWLLVAIAILAGIVVIIVVAKGSGSKSDSSAQ